MGHFRKQLAYSDVKDNDPFVVGARQDISDYITIILTNNCKLLKYYGLTLTGQIELVYLANGIRLNKYTLCRLKNQKHKDCSFRLLGYILKFWGLPLSVMASREFEADKVCSIVLFPSFVNVSKV